MQVRIAGQPTARFKLDYGGFQTDLLQVPSGYTGAPGTYAAYLQNQINTKLTNIAGDLTAGVPGATRIIYGGDCYNYGLLASGQIDLVVEAGLKLHDIAALVPVVEGAGGMMCDWNGEPLRSASLDDMAIHDVIALGDPARLDDVLEGLACNH